MSGDSQVKFVLVESTREAEINTAFVQAVVAVLRAKQQLKSKTAMRLGGSSGAKK